MITASPLCADLLAGVHRACFGPAAWSAASIAALFTTGLVFGYALEPGGMVLARAVADEAEILTIGVVPAARRQGLARRLLGLAAAEAGRRGAATLFLEVAADNEPALCLYRAFGFADCAIRRDYYGRGRDALLLKRPLCE
ncbi:GNAT family N-acetyltransferase [Acidiphilium sp. PA]|uniref:GNAT family N-acetyltransferase n=1 Tax=Acidiphilium sp. PA TaxID=2871705 RepID=UPI002243F8B5|nr:GNAT family N-acetyltransferase [Acidiphilium sp. PA]